MYPNAAKTKNCKKGFTGGKSFPCKTCFLGRNIVQPAPSPAWLYKVFTNGMQRISVEKKIIAIAMGKPRMLKGSKPKFSKKGRLFMTVSRASGLALGPCWRNQTGHAGYNQYCRNLCKLKIDGAVGVQPTPWAVDSKKEVRSMSGLVCGL